MIRCKLTLESRIARLEKLLVKRESYDATTAKQVTTAVTNWVYGMWNNKDCCPLFRKSALAYINGYDDGDWVIDKCLDVLEAQGFVFDNEDVDYISDCLSNAIATIAEADESRERRVKHNNNKRRPRRRF